MRLRLPRWPRAVWRVLWGSVNALVEGRGTRVGAQLAFYLLMSMPALLLVVIWGLGALLDQPDVRQDLINEIMNLLPLDAVAGREEVGQLLASIANGAGSLGVVAIIGLFYAISGSVGALRYAIESAANVARRRTPDTTLHRAFIHGKPVDLAVTLVVIPAALIVAALGISTPLLGTVNEQVPLFGAVNSLVTKLLPLGLGLVAFMVLFHTLSPPQARLTWIASLLGASVSILSLGLVIFGLDLFFSVVDTRNAVYGAIAGFLAVAFSVNLIALGVVYGAYVATTVSERMKIVARRAVRFPDR